MSTILPPDSPEARACASTMPPSDRLPRPSSLPDDMQTLIAGIADAVAVRIEAGIGARLDRAISRVDQDLAEIRRDNRRLAAKHKALTVEHKALAALVAELDQRTRK